MKLYLLFSLVWFGQILSRHGIADGNPAEFRNIVHRFERYYFYRGARPVTGGKPKRINMVFVIQNSLSMTEKSFNDSMDLVSNIIPFFSLSTRSTKVAVVAVGKEANTLIGFHQYKNRDCLTGGIKSAKYDNSTEFNMAAGLQEAHDLFVNMEKNKNDNEERIVFLITNGQSSSENDAEAIAQKIKQTLFGYIFVIATGERPNMGLIRKCVTLSHYKHLYVIKNSDDFKTLINLSTHTKRYTQCLFNAGTVYDECMRFCTCQNGYLTNCTRIRKEFMSMSYYNRVNYIMTYKKLTTQEPYKTKYETFIRIHERIFGTEIHQQSQFLPWHRWFMLELENQLREIDCTVTIPYWDWSISSLDPWNTGNLWSEKYYGFGGNGIVDFTRWTSCVQKGPFSKAMSGWTLPGGACLERHFNGILPNQTAIAASLSLNDFRDFELNLRGNLHDQMHCLIDGTMCSERSAAAPEFFLHHGFIDKIWSVWQSERTKFRNGFFFFNDKPMVNSRYNRSEVVDLLHQPYCVRVMYEEPISQLAAGVKKEKLQVKSPSELRYILRLISSAVSQKARALFKLTPEEEQRCEQLKKLTHSSMEEATETLYMQSLVKDENNVTTV